MARRRRGPHPDRPERDLRARRPRGDRAPRDRHRAVRRDPGPARELLAAQGASTTRSSARSRRGRRAAASTSASSSSSSRRTFGMLFIGLIAVAGFTVLARRRTRAIGMLGALGADESLVRLALLVNGLVVGLAAMVLGGVVGLAGVVALRAAPAVERRPRRRPRGDPVVARRRRPWCSPRSRPRSPRAGPRAPPRGSRSSRRCRAGPPSRRRRAATPRVGAGILAGGVVIVFAGGAAGHGGDGGGSGRGRAVRAARDRRRRASGCSWSPSGSSPSSAGSRPGRRSPPRSPCATSRGTGRAPGPRSGAICLALLVTGVVVVAATARYSDPFDWVGPNLSSNVVMVYPRNHGRGPGPVQCTPTQGVRARAAAPAADDDGRAVHRGRQARSPAAIGATSTLPLYLANAGLNRTTSGPQFTGAGVRGDAGAARALRHRAVVDQPRPRSCSPSRAGLAGDAGQLALVLRPGLDEPGFFNGNVGPCPPGYCVPDPSVQYVPQLPDGHVRAEHGAHDARRARRCT